MAYRIGLIEKCIYQADHGKFRIEYKIKGKKYRALFDTIEEAREALPLSCRVQGSQLNEKANRLDLRDISWEPRILRHPSGWDNAYNVYGH